MFLELATRPFRQEVQRIAISSFLNREYRALQNGLGSMAKTFKRGDHVEWNSEAGRVRGVIVKKVVSDVRLKGYVHHATKQEPQYFIKSDKTPHIAIHKGSALRLISSRSEKKAKRPVKRRRGRRSSA
jgi:Hypervirulence associated proteins TUDOR domain